MPEAWQGRPPGGRTLVVVGDLERGVGLAGDILLSRRTREKGT